MAGALTIRLPQETETPLKITQREHFGYRLAYARSLDSKTHDDKGQDYLVLREDEARLAFSLCDGVSQSFYGDIAAQILGDTLLEWMWETYKFSKQITDELMPVAQNLVHEGRKQVDPYPLPVNIPNMVRDVLEKKREIGSESTFVAGVMDSRIKKLAFVWMGDSRLRLWSSKAEITHKLGNTFHTKERWSSHKGLIGELHGFVCPLKSVRRIAVYSDGLVGIESQFNNFVPEEEMTRLIAQTEQSPTSDDVSMLEIWFAPKTPIGDEKHG
jgi:hypothetical protein